MPCTRPNDRTQKGLLPPRARERERERESELDKGMLNSSKCHVQPSPSTKMVDGAAQKSGERGLPFLLAQEQSKAKQRERERERDRERERERERDGRPDADRPAPGHERPPRDKALPPHWEGDKIEGTDVTAAGTPRMQSSPDEEEGRPPLKRHKPAQAATKRQEPLLAHGVRTCPRCLVGPGREKGGTHWSHDREADNCAR